MSVFAHFHRLVGQVTGRTAAAVPSDSERRAKTRSVAVNDRGFVSFPMRPAHPPARCKIENISTDGARIAFSDDSPDASLLDGGIRLYVERRGQEWECKVAWRKDGVFGLKFTSEPFEPSRAYGTLLT